MAGAHAAGAGRHAAPKGPKHAGARAPKGSTSSGVPRHSGGPRHAAPKTGPGKLDDGGTVQRGVDRAARAAGKPVVSGFQFGAAQAGAFGKGAVKEGGSALPFLLVGTFLIIVLAKFRGEGQNEVSIAKAFFGGLILAFFLTMLAQWNKRLATLFAALIFIGVLIDQGPAAFGGLFTDQTQPLLGNLDLPNPAELNYKLNDQGQWVPRTEKEKKAVVKKLKEATTTVGDDGMPGSLSDLPPMIRDQILRGNM